MFVRSIFCALALALATGTGGATTRDGQELAFTVRQEHFESSGVKIQADVYTPASAGRIRP